MYREVLMLFNVIIVSAMYSSKALEGYPAGYLSDCPGANISVPVSPEALRLLTISLQVKTSIFQPKPIYNYYQMKKLAKDPHLDFGKPSVLFISGYLDHPNFFIGQSFGELYKKLGYNVFLLNTNPFTFTHYSIAARNVRSISKSVAEIFVYLSQNGLDPKKLSMVGLSLGAHTASFIAKHFKVMTGISIARITGLDPSGPCFRNLGPEDRLDQSDADFVDIVSTNIDGYGMAAPIGHVNFYVNGGEFQPGDYFWVPCTGLCSHLRSYTIWIAALNFPDCFIGMKCESVQDARNRNCYDRKPLVTNLMGLASDRKIEGIFYLATSNNYPYFLKEKGLKKKYEFFDGHLSLTRKGKNLPKDTDLVSQIYKNASFCGFIVRLGSFFNFLANLFCNNTDAELQLN